MRPAARAALELGAPTFLEGAQAAMTVGLDEFEAAVAALSPGTGERQRQRLARAIRRTLFAALLDTALSPQELAAELRFLIAGRGPAAVSRSGQGAGTDTPTPPLVAAP